MTLNVPPLPPILAGANVQLWRKWFAFYWLPLERKADLVDQYPDLAIVLPPTAPHKDGPRHRVFFNPDVFDTQVRSEDVFKAWDHVKFHEGFYPRQQTPDMVNLQTLYARLDSTNHAVLAYKYRYVVRPESYFFHMDFDDALKAATTLEELFTFYEAP